MEYCDRRQDILQWGSEELIVPYFFSGDGKWHRYYPDFVVNVNTKTGAKQTWLVEIKPAAQVQHPGTKKFKNPRQQLRETVTYAKNQAKWAAATTFCSNKGWKFIILTEKELYPNGR